MTLTAKTIFPRSAFVGFDTMIDDMDRITRHSNDTFPPHNILKTGEDQYLIELAVAGFSEEELEIDGIEWTCMHLENEPGVTPIRCSSLFL